MTRVLVTGATGFIGARLVRRLGPAAIAGGRGVRPSGRLDDWSGDWVRIEPHDRRSVVAAIRQTSADAVVHTAVARDAADVARRRSEVVMVESVCSAVVETEVECLVVLGSGSEYGLAPAPHREDLPPLPSTPHGVAKAAGTRVALQWAADPGGPDITVLRPFHVIGPGEPREKLVPRALAAACGGPALPMVSGAPVRDVVGVDDVVTAILAALADPVTDGLPVNLCTGRATSIPDLVATVERICGAPVPIIGEYPRSGYDDEPRVGDPTRASTLWGWRAQPLDEVVAAVVAAWPWDTP